MFLIHRQADKHIARQGRVLCRQGGTEITLPPSFSRGDDDTGLRSDGYQTLSFGLVPGRDLVKLFECKGPLVFSWRAGGMGVGYRKVRSRRGGVVQRSLGMVSADKGRMLSRGCG